jgi:hypothetical protein
MRSKKPPPTLAKATVPQSHLSAWRAAWGLEPGMTYVGWADPLPLPPMGPCKACLGGTLFWTEATPPHRQWRCSNCHPPPATMPIRHWSPDPVYAEERDAVAAEAPERKGAHDEWI